MESRTPEEIARDPNTPPEQLAQLMGTHPRLVLENPILPLLFVENQNWLNPDKNSRPELTALLHLPHVPQYITNVLKKHPYWYVQELAKMHISQDEVEGSWQAYLISMLCSELYIPEYWGKHKQKDDMYIQQLYNQLLHHKLIPVWLKDNFTNLVPMNVYRSSENFAPDDRDINLLIQEFDTHIKNRYQGSRTIFFQSIGILVMADTPKNIFIDCLVLQGDDYDNGSPLTSFLGMMHTANLVLIEEILSSHWWWNHLALTLNPHTPDDILEGLANHGNRYVVRFAKARLEGNPIELS